MQNQHITDVTQVEIDDEQQLIIDYIRQLENNIEHLKEQCIILQTQKEMAQGKAKRLEHQVLYLQNIILQNDPTK